MSYPNHPPDPTIVSKVFLNRIFDVLKRGTDDSETDLSPILSLYDIEHDKNAKQIDHTLFDMLRVTTLHMSGMFVDKIKRSETKPGGLDIRHSAYEKLHLLRGSIGFVIPTAQDYIAADIERTLTYKNKIYKVKYTVELADGQYLPELPVLEDIPISE